MYCVFVIFLEVVYYITFRKLYKTAILFLVKKGSISLVYLLKNYFLLSNFFNSQKDMILNKKNSTLLDIF